MNVFLRFIGTVLIVPAWIVFQSAAVLTWYYSRQMIPGILSGLGLIYFFFLLIKRYPLSTWWERSTLYFLLVLLLDGFAAHQLLLNLDYIDGHENDREFHRSLISPSNDMKGRDAITKYRLVLKMAADGSKCRGKETITWINRSSGPVSEIHIRLPMAFNRRPFGCSHIAIRSICSVAGEALSFRRTVDESSWNAIFYPGNMLIVRSSHAIQPGESFEFSIDFSLKTCDPAIYFHSFNEPANDWFPRVVPQIGGVWVPTVNDMIDISLRLEYPDHETRWVYSGKNFHRHTSGTGTEIEIETGPTRTFTLMPLENPYVLMENLAGIPVRIYLPERRLPGIPRDHLLSLLEKSVVFFKDQFGRIPFDHFNLVITPGNRDEPLLVGNDCAWLSVPETSLETDLLFDYDVFYNFYIPNAIAQQYFGGVQTQTGRWPFWIMRGLAAFYTQRFCREIGFRFEHPYYEEFRRLVVSDIHPAVLRQTEARRRRRQLFEKVNYDHILADFRGCAIMSRLFLVMGQASFDRVITSLLSRPSELPVDYPTFRTLCRREADIEIHRMIAPFLFNGSYLDVGITRVSRSNSTDGTETVYVYLVRRAGPAIPIPVIIETTERPVRTFWTDHRRNSLLTVPVSAHVRRVVLGGKTLLYDLTPEDNIYPSSPDQAIGPLIPHPGI